MKYFDKLLVYGRANRPCSYCVKKVNENQVIKIDKEGGMFVLKINAIRINFRMRLN